MVRDGLKGGEEGDFSSKGKEARSQAFVRGRGLWKKFALWVCQDWRGNGSAPPFLLSSRGFSCACVLARAGAIDLREGQSQQEREDYSSVARYAELWHLFLPIANALVIIICLVDHRFCGQPFAEGLPSPASISRRLCPGQPQTEAAGGGGKKPAKQRDWELIRAAPSSSGNAR